MKLKVRKTRLEKKTNLLIFFQVNYSFRDFKNRAKENAKSFGLELYIVGDYISIGHLNYAYERESWVLLIIVNEITENNAG